MRSKGLLYFLILCAVALVGWVGGWTRAMRAGQDAYQQEHYHAAEIAFREATLQKPNDAIAHYNLGAARYRSGKFGEAIQAFRESLASHSRASEKTLNVAHIYYNLGNAHFQVGDLRRAIEAYRHALRSKPRGP